MGAAKDPFSAAFASVIAVRGLLKERHVCFSVAGMLSVDFDDPRMPVKYGLTNPKVLFMEAVGLCWHAHCQRPGHLLL